MLVELLIDTFGALGGFVDDLCCFAGSVIFILAEISFMPRLGHVVVAWIFRLTGIGIACYLWYLSVKLFKKNKWTIPGIFNFLAYFVLFIACCETDVVVYQCENMNCSLFIEETYYGIVGVCVYKTERHIGSCVCKDSERQLWKAQEMRFWGGFIGALPVRDEMIHKFGSTCPCCGSHVATYNLPKCKNCQGVVNDMQWEPPPYVSPR